MTATRSVPRRARCWPALALCAALAACSSASNGGDCEPGSVGCDCAPDDACDRGLECLSGLCVVRAFPDASTGTPPDDPDPDAGTPVDAGMGPAIGELDGPCDREGLRACAGENSRDKLVCIDGAFEADGSCDGSSRCNTVTGDEQGVCLAVVGECDGRQPGDLVCQGDARVACGPDLLTVEDTPCDAPRVCNADSGETACVCGPGYELQGETCVDVDDCAGDPCQNGGTCADQLGGFECTCSTAWTGDTCEQNVDECGDAALNGCDAIAACEDSDGGYSCTCPAGTADDAGDGSRCETWEWVTAGRFRTCAIRSGKLYCWGMRIGDNENNTDDRPVRIGDQSDWTRIDLGPNLACGIRGGELYCWGFGNFGGLGNDVLTQPTPLQVGTASDWTEVSASFSHSCGLRGANLYCWGLNSLGQLGDNSTDVSIGPKLLIGNAWSAISAGEFFTFGIQSGSLYEWGDKPWDMVTGGPNVPSALASTDGTTSISAGHSHACIVRNSRLYCWGSDDEGQLGLGGSGDQTGPAEVAGGNWVSVAVSGPTGSGNNGHTCAINDEGELLCWGDGAAGQLGKGNYDSEDRPSVVGGDKDWTAVSASDTHTCGIRSGRLFCWGANEAGQLGDGSMLTKNAPAAVVD